LLLRFERECWAQGWRRVAGVDEAGRGPLAGPVVAAAVVFTREAAEAGAAGPLAGVRDSKQVAPDARERLFRLLHDLPGVEIGIGSADVEEIDRLNILRATHAAMARAVNALPSLPDHILVDGLPVRGLPCASTPIVSGDALSFSIAAASIVAKVFRDALMCELDRLYPQYGFARHKGYGTSDHIQALFEFGPSPAHRRSFRPVREAAAIRERTGPET
jgi:ribonuclease HII